MNKIPRTYGRTEIGQAPRIIPPEGTLPRCPHGNYAPHGDTSNCFLCHPVRPDDQAAQPIRKTEEAL
jgi:hypothetical protein